MNLLLDTHIFIWAYTEPDRLAGPVLNAIQDPANTVYLSAASVWEMQIKQMTGKLDVVGPSVRVFVEAQRALNDIRSLPVFERHIWALAGLPSHHRDPFDRLLMAQALAEGWPLATADPIFQQYPVALLT